MNASSKARVTGTNTSRPKYSVATIITNSVMAFDGSGAAAGPTGFGGGAGAGDVSDMVSSKIRSLQTAYQEEALRVRRADVSAESFDLSDCIKRAFFSTRNIDA